MSCAAQWQAAWAEFDGGGESPRAITREVVEQTGACVRRQQQEEEQQLSFARQWLACLEEFSGTVSERLPQYANLVAATTSTLPSDQHFGDAAPHGRGFDLLLWQEADQATESEFLILARRAQRWILVGEAEAAACAPPRDRAATAVEPSLPRSPVHPRSLVPALRPGFFQRLWQHLHADPRALPYAWLQENDRLCCRLRPLTPAQSPWIERECVLDRPDIELRILTLPRAQPVLAEVVFPPSMSLRQAKEFIYRELQELAVVATEPGLHWSADAERLVLRLAHHDLPEDALAVGLDNGIRELLAPCSWQTCQLEFARSSGWNRTRAEQWIRRYLGLRDLGRTACLQNAQRMHPHLAALLSDWLFAGSYRFQGTRKDAEDPALLPAGPVSASRCLAVNGGSPLVTFIPVPAQSGDCQGWKQGENETGRDNSHRHATAPRSRGSRGGAGLELDLADRQHRDRLPPELRPHLPEEGLVNYLEAQAVVRALTILAADPAFRAVAQASGEGFGKRPAVVVLALYRAQVELIRLLAEQNPALAASGIAVEFGLPEDFREREALVVFVSLTRSHAHRAVVFGGGPQDLALALTRAERKLVLFGDPGTLARRGQWDGPVDHLDVAAAAHERQLIAHLVHYLHGQGPHQHVFHTCEGNA